MLKKLPVADSSFYLCQTCLMSLCRESAIDASIYHTSVSSLVDFRKPLCGTAPSVIPIRRGNNANSCRCAFLTLLFPFLSPCFLSLLTGADMSNFVFRVARFGNVVKGSKTSTILTYEIVDRRCISYVSGFHKRPIPRAFTESRSSQPHMY